MGDSVFAFSEAPQMAKRSRTSHLQDMKAFQLIDILGGKEIGELVALGRRGRGRGYSLDNSALEASANANVVQQKQQRKENSNSSNSNSGKRSRKRNDFEIAAAIEEKMNPIHSNQNQNQKFRQLGNFGENVSGNSKENLTTFNTPSSFKKAAFYPYPAEVTPDSIDFQQDKENRITSTDNSSSSSFIVGMAGFEEVDFDESGELEIYKQVEVDSDEEDEDAYMEEEQVFVPYNSCLMRPISSSTRGVAVTRSSSSSGVRSSSNSSNMKINNKTNVNTANMSVDDSVLETSVPTPTSSARPLKIRDYYQFDRPMYELDQVNEGGNEEEKSEAVTMDMAAECGEGGGTGSLTGACSRCKDSGNNYKLPCTFCLRSFCDNGLCIQACFMCTDMFCDRCSTLNYEIQSRERSICIDCSYNK